MPPAPPPPLLLLLMMMLASDPVRPSFLLDHELALSSIMYPCRISSSLILSAASKSFWRRAAMRSFMSRAMSGGMESFLGALTGRPFARLTFFAALAPLRPGPTSNSTSCSGARDGRAPGMFGSARISERWTNSSSSSPQSGSGMMNPKPFMSCQFLTLPRILC